MISRHLFHFAMVHEQFGKTGDITEGLLPIFTPLLRNKEGELFSVTDFCLDIDKEYGLQIHPYVIEDMIPNLIKLGVLQEKDNLSSNVLIYIGQISCEEDNNINDSLERICNGFKAMSLKVLDKVELTSNHVDFNAEFSKRLARTNYDLNTGVEVENFREKTIHSNIDSILDYCFARFITELIETDADEFEVVKQAYSGAILAEVVLSLRDPGMSKGDIEGKRFYIDAPVLLNLLGFNSSYAVNCSQSLIKQIIENGGILTTSDTYIKEAKNSINWALRNYENKGGRKSNLCKYIFKKPEAIVEVRYAQTSIDKLLIKMGFNLEGTFTNLGGRIVSQRAKSFSAKIEQLLNWYKNEEGAAHDAEMVTYVVQDHSYSSIKSISESKSFFITNNERQVSEVNKYLYSDGLFEKPEITPILSERNLATIMWVVTGGKGKDVSSLTLISNCTRAMDMNKETFLNFAVFLNNLPDDKKEIYEDIIANDRAIHCLMDEVGGDFSKITENNSEKILGRSFEQLKEDIKQETINNQKDVDQENNILKESLEKTESKLEKALTTLKHKSKKELEISEKLKNLKNIQEDVVVTDNVDAEIGLSDADQKKLKNLEKQAVKISNGVGKVLSGIGIIIYCFIIFKLAQFSITSVVENDYIKIKEPLVEYIPFMIIFLTFWKVPNIILGRPINAAKRSIYNYISPND